MTAGGLLPEKAKPAGTHPGRSTEVLNFSPHPKVLFARILIFLFGLAGFFTLFMDSVEVLLLRRSGSLIVSRSLSVGPFIHIVVVFFGHSESRDDIYI